MLGQRQLEAQDFVLQVAGHHHVVHNASSAQGAASSAESIHYRPLLPMTPMTEKSTEDVIQLELQCFLLIHNHQPFCVHIVVHAVMNHSSLPLTLMLLNLNQFQ